VSTDPFRLSSDPRLLDRDVEAPIARLSDFDLVRQLGDHDGVRSYLAERKGAFGFTKRVMLKVASSPFNDGMDVALRLTDEARLGMRLNHPNLLQTLDLGRDGDRFFLVREWVDGLGLRGLMSRVWGTGSAFPAPAVLRIGIRVTRALVYLHGLRQAPWAPRGIVHRGITPSNILLSRAGEARLANLFMARPAGRRQGQPELHASARLIPAYCAPEILEGGPPGPRSDVYSLGAVLYECLVGPDAFEGDSGSDWNRHRDDERMAGLLEEAPLGDDLREILVRATAPLAKHRYGSAEDLGIDLRRVLRDEHRSDGDEELRGLLLEHFA
jgi:serine/threonine-protein kinase